MEKECTEVLHDKEGCTAFKQYLKNACAAEVLNFWIEVELYKKIHNFEELSSKAHHLFNKYLEFGTETEINVDERSRVVVKEVLQTGNGIDTKLFDKVQQQAFDLLCSDCFLGFKHSDLYKQYIEQSSMYQLVSTPHSAILNPNAYLSIQERPTKLSGLSSVVHKTFTLRSNRRQLTDSQRIMRDYFDKMKHTEG